MPYTYETRVYEYLCDETGGITLGYTMRTLQEIATEHFATQNGLDSSEKGAWPISFLLNGMRIVLHKRPLMGETICLQTYFKEVKGVFFIRNTQILDAQGSVLVDCSANWFLVDSKTHAVMKPKDLMYQNEAEDIPFPITPQRKLQCPFETLKKRDTRRVYRSMLDVNGHMNNAVYGDFATDALYQYLVNARYNCFDILFHREAMAGDSMDIYTGESEQGIFVVGAAENQLPSAREHLFQAKFSRL